MVTVPPDGHGNRGNIQAEHDGFIGRPTIGNEIVPAKHPMSLREPSRSLYWASGGPLSMQGESEARVKSPLARSVNFGSASKFSLPATVPLIFVTSFLVFPQVVVP